MWNALEKAFPSVFGKPKRILMFGLDSVGKTTILSQLKLGKVQYTKAIEGFFIESLPLQNDLTLSAWDLGGSTTIRTAWKPHFASVCAVIFVVDLMDKERLNDEMNYVHSRTAQAELQWVLEEFPHVPILVLANKQDLLEAMSVNEVTSKLDLENLLQNRAWLIQGCSARNGDGLKEGMDWLANSLSKPNLFHIEEKEAAN
jgi:small GTP-binding protein